MVLFLILGADVFLAGCSAPDMLVDTIGPSSPPTNITYAKFGFSFLYPDNLEPTEYDTTFDKNARWENGVIQLEGESSDNITVNWISMHHAPLNMPVFYESLRAPLRKDPEVSNVKFFLLETYPATTCGDATFIGHASHYDKGRNIQTNEGILLWYHPKQDRTYFIDMASAKDYDTFIKKTLSGFQQSFKCTDT
jgi:hypothetical protein